MGALIGKGLFPPLPETGNRRSMIHVDDVVNAMICVADAPQAAGKIYILAGDDAPSGRALYDALRSAMALDRVTWSVPKALLRTAAQAGDIAGRLLRRRMPLDSEVLDRLLKSAWYSSEKIRRELGWHPKVNLRDGLKEMLGR
jgi:nucleoside-diphosphate-sugar epimerase